MHEATSPSVGRGAARRTRWGRAPPELTPSPTAEDAVLHVEGAAAAALEARASFLSERAAGAAAPFAQRAGAVHHRPAAPAPRSAGRRPRRSAMGRGAGGAVLGAFRKQGSRAANEQRSTPAPPARRPAAGAGAASARNPTLPAMPMQDPSMVRVVERTDLRGERTVRREEAGRFGALPAMPMQDASTLRVVERTHLQSERTIRREEAARFAHFLNPWGESDAGVEARATADAPACPPRKHTSPTPFVTSVFGDSRRLPPFVVDAGAPRAGLTGGGKSEFYAEYQISVDGDLPDAAASEDDGASEASTEDQHVERDVTPRLPADGSLCGGSTRESRLRRSAFATSSLDQTSEEEGESVVAEAMALDVREAGGCGLGGGDGGGETGGRRWKMQGPVPRSIFLPDYLHTTHHERADTAKPAPPTRKKQQLARVSRGAPRGGGRCRRKVVFVL